MSLSTFEGLPGILGMDDGETLHSLRAGCAVTLSVRGGPDGYGGHYETCWLVHAYVYGALVLTHSNRNLNPLFQKSFYYVI